MALNFGNDSNYDNLKSFGSSILGSNLQQHAVIQSKSTDQINNIKENGSIMEQSQQQGGEEEEQMAPSISVTGISGVTPFVVPPGNIDKNENNHE